MTQTNEKLIFIDVENENATEKTNQVKVIAGLTGVGKTQEAYKEIIEQLKLGKNVLLFSLETNLTETNKQILRAALPELYVKISKAQGLTPEEGAKLDETVTLIQKGNLSIVSKYPVTEDEVVAKMTEAANSEEGLDMVVIDNFALLQRNDDEVRLNLEESVKAFQLEQGLKVLITMQLNRGYFQKEA